MTRHASKASRHTSCFEFSVAVHMTNGKKKTIALGQHGLASHVLPRVRLGALLVHAKRKTLSPSLGSSISTAGITRLSLTHLDERYTQCHRQIYSRSTCGSVMSFFVLSKNVELERGRSPLGGRSSLSLVDLTPSYSHYRLFSFFTSHHDDRADAQLPSSSI